MDRGARIVVFVGLAVVIVVAALWATGVVRFGLTGDHEGPTFLKKFRLTDDPSSNKPIEKASYEGHEQWIKGTPPATPPLLAEVVLVPDLVQPAPGPLQSAPPDNFVEQTNPAGTDYDIKSFRIKLTVDGMDYTSKLTRPPTDAFICQVQAKFLGMTTTVPIRPQVQWVGAVYDVNPMNPCVAVTSPIDLEWEP